MKEFNKLTEENFAATLKQANLATKADIDDFVPKTDFDDKLKKLNKKVASHKTKHVDTEKKLTDITPISQKGHDFLLGKKLNHLILTLNRPCLI